MEFKEITLLTATEYEECKDIVPHLREEYWWLRTIGSDKNAVCFVRRDGLVNPIGHPCDHKFVTVRPVCAFDLDFSDLMFWSKTEDLLGSKIKFGKYTWTIFNVVNGKLRALCDEVIAKHWFDPKTNAWTKSELKTWLETEGLKLITE